MLNTDNTTEEIWKPIVGFEGIYEVSNTGYIRNSRKKVMKTYTINSGYQCLKLTVDNVRTSHLLHRLVAAAFCDKSDEHTQVNHIDGNKDNNHHENLEWCTDSHNKRHGVAAGLYAAIFLTRNSLGKKHKPNTSSKYHNVSYDKARQKWSAVIISNKKRYGFKRFNTEEEAALHVNYIIDTYNFTDRPKNIIS